MELVLLVFMIIGAWSSAGLLAWSMTLGSFTKAWPYMNHVKSSLFMAISGPFGVLASFTYSLFDGGFGWLLFPKSYNERLSLFNEKYPSLGKEYFDIHHKRSN